MSIACSDKKWSKNYTTYIKKIIKLSACQVMASQVFVLCAWCYKVRSQFINRVQIRRPEKYDVKIIMKTRCGEYWVGFKLLKFSNWDGGCKVGLFAVMGRDFLLFQFGGLFLKVYNRLYNEYHPDALMKYALHLYPARVSSLYLII